MGIWQKEKGNTFFSSEDLEEFLLFGKSLGYLDKTQLSGNLHDNHYISRLQNQLNNLPKQDKRLEMVALPDTTGNVVKTNDYNDHFVVLSLWGICR